MPARPSATRSAAAAAKAGQIAALQGALAAEHAAIYGYGVVGAMLSGRLQSQAHDYWVDHQEARDTLEAMLLKLGATPTAASPAYQLPFAVAGEASAAALAVVLEDGVVQAYLGVVGVTDPTLRSFGALAMQPPANRAVVWRGSTVAFPGLPTSSTR
jgi:hypothetical protein